METSASRRTTATAGTDGRISQSPGTLFSKSTGWYLPRRGADVQTAIQLQTFDGISRLAMSQPLELLTLLPDLVPEVGLALWNGTFLGCGPESLRLKAMAKTAAGKSEEAPDGTAQIDRLWRENPDEAGDLIDCLAQNYQMLMFSGMVSTEAVPGGRMAGVQAAFPINTLTLRYQRDKANKLVLCQKQIMNPNSLVGYSGGLGGLYIELPDNRVFTKRLPGLPDDLYGRVPFAPALTVVLEGLAFWRDTMLAWHRVGTPSIDIGFDFEMWASIARDAIGLTDPEAINKYVDDRFAEAVAFVKTKKPDDAYLHDLKSKVGAVGTGGQWGDVATLWSMIRLRLIQALKQLPTIMGVVEGDTETWSKVQWQIYTNSLRSLVAKAAGPLIKASQLHLQLLGLPYTVEPEYAPVESIMRLVDAQAKGLEIANEARLRDEGLQTQETTAMALTGSAPVAPGPIRPVGAQPDFQPGPDQNTHKAGGDRP
jgi:hypothetical protein